MTQVYTSVHEHLRALGVSLDALQTAAVNQVLGDSWHPAWLRPPLVEGNYGMVLRNGQWVFAQAIKSFPDAPLVYVCSQYAAPLTILDASATTEKMPDDRSWWALWTSEDSGFGYKFTNLDGALTLLEPGPRALRVRKLAGPYVNCWGWRVEAPNEVPPGISPRDLCQSLVNMLAAAENQIVWWRLLTLPPHYTAADLPTRVPT